MAAGTFPPSPKKAAPPVLAEPCQAGKVIGSRVTPGITPARLSRISSM
jgi:hypothetical protein